MDRKGLMISERISEVTMMCGREHPIYEHVGSFGIALYVLGFIDAADVMSFRDIDQGDAAGILKEHFTEIDKTDLPSTYRIAESPQKYLLVIGDPAFPVHFAVLTDAQSQKPFFSKLRYFGTGFDSLEELMSDFLEEGGISDADIHYFRQNISEVVAPSSTAKIYIIKDDGRVVSDAREQLFSPMKEAACRS